MIKKISVLTIIAIFFMCFPVNSWELYDRIIATVNDTPIVESEVILKFNRMLKTKKIPRKKRITEKSRLLDRYIEEAIVEQTAARESIIVSDLKIDNHLQKIMQRMNVKSIDRLKIIVEKKEKIPFSEYREEIRKSLISELVMSIAIGVSPPSMDEARQWYRLNRKKMGFEINYHHILIRMKGEGFAENKKAYSKAKDILSSLRKGKKIEALAKQHSQDSSKKKGGAAGWVSISNMAREDMILANNLYKLFLVDKRKTGIVKSSQGYYIVRLNKKRPTSFESVRNEILNLLYQKRLSDQFKKWVYRKRLESDLKIYMKDYISSAGKRS